MKLWGLVVLMAGGCFQSATAQVLADDIFNSGLESGIAFQGTAGYPGPLANATIELHLGNYVATTATKADGTYRLLVESRYFASVTIAELFAFGSGADVTKVWASPLGPSDRLQTLGADGTVTFAEEPFLNLNPRSTALAGALRAYNGFAPITDKATFYKAARSYQDFVQDLTYALALVARGDQALPSGAANTFAAVTSLALSQRLYADWRPLADVDCANSPKLANCVDCAITPTTSYCQVTTTLKTDPAIIPTYPWNDGRTYLFGLVGFQNSLYQPNVARPHAGTVDFLRSDGTFVTTNSVLQSDGSYLLTLSGGATITSGDDYPPDPPYNGLVRRHDEVLAIHARSVRGPGGQTESQGYGDHRVTYPDNPGIQPQPTYYSDIYGLPRYTGNDLLPAELVADVPILASGTKNFMLASPFAVDPGVDPTYGYDVYSFGTISGGTGSGFSSRQGKSFSYSVPDPASFSLNFSADATTVDVQFINEESPGIWRVSVHATAPSSQQFFVGLFMMKNTPAFSGFSATNVSGNSFATSVDEEICGGPYALLSVLDPNSFCRPPYFGWIFGASNTVNRLQNGASWGVWQLPGGANSGRLLFANPSFVASPIQQERGWELARSDAGYTDMWVLENVTVNPQPANTGAPPVVFRPTGRLSHVTKQP